MTEILAIYSFLTARLKSSPELAAIVSDRVYAGIAPAKDARTQKPPAYPIISFSVRTSRDITVVDGESAYLDCTVDVKLVHMGGLGAMQEADRLIFSLLHRPPNHVTVGDVDIMGCHREGHTLAERADGDVIYRYSIQTYRIRAARRANGGAISQIADPSA
jgi:hypothetical protein